MTTYEMNIDTVNTSLTYFQAEKYIYGSSRLGMLKDSVNVLGSAYTNTDTSNFVHTLGNKRYELSNHLGNVLTVISDKPIPHNNGGMVDYWQADIKSAYDYSPFGVMLTGRTFEGRETVCHDSTVQATQNALEEGFGTWGSWTAMADGLVTYVADEMQVSNPSTSKKNIGTSKTFTTGEGLHSVSFVVIGNMCSNIVIWPPSSTPIPIQVFVRDNANNIVASGNYTTAGSYNLSFTPVSSGANYKIEFYMANASAFCFFRVVDVLVNFEDESVLTVCREVESFYKYGFGGQEKDDEVSGIGNSYTAEFWQYDSRLGRRWNIDPMSAKYPWQSPYATFNNNPIFFIDPLGLEGTNTTGEKEPRKESRKEKKERQQKIFGSKDDGVDLDEVQVLPSSPAKQEKPKSKGYEWMSGASMKNFFGSGPSLGREGKGVYYTDKTNPYYEDWMKGRANHKALEGFFVDYALTSLTAPFGGYGGFGTKITFSMFLRQAMVHGTINASANLGSQMFANKGNFGEIDKLSVGLSFGSAFIPGRYGVQGSVTAGIFDGLFDYKNKGLVGIHTGKPVLQIISDGSFSTIGNLGFNSFGKLNPVLSPAAHWVTTLPATSLNVIVNEQIK